jgi:hypothetical protein
VVLEFALALTLLTGGGLAMQSLFMLTTLDFGFRIWQLLTLSLFVPEDRLVMPERTSVFYWELLERV